MSSGHGEKKKKQKATLIRSLNRRAKNARFVQSSTRDAFATLSLILFFVSFFSFAFVRFFGAFQGETARLALRGTSGASQEHRDKGWSGHLMNKNKTAKTRTWRRSHAHTQSKRRTCPRVPLHVASSIGSFGDRARQTGLRGLFNFVVS